MSGKPKILFLCTGNSCRSQMAEAWTRHLKADHYEPYSAGVEVRPVDPLAISVMAEVGLDISGQRSKHVDSLKDLEFDYVVTVCDHAREACPFFPARTRLLHREFADPPRLAQTARNEEEAMEHYRKVRDEIKAFVEDLEGILARDR
ncbi:MAG: arsenate reductase ArsC [Desulfomonile tiedjei]|uniref:Arsenate reductase ArsC n=1 Tax=Desulfomonile tiedjei TaxID=2358 RepID=A0A9D6UYG7_9BACT|nr:arsenate reductase ArsC [Desulfomonile tiedjei]